MVREDANIGPMNSERVLSWDTLAPAAQLQLLGNSFMRVRDGCTVMPLLGLPGLAWLYSLGLWPPGITLWWGASLLLVGAVWGVWGLWQRALKQRDSHGAATLLVLMPGWRERPQAACDFARTPTPASALPSRWAARNGRAAAPTW